jgi:hypothetical protein
MIGGAMRCGGMIDVEWMDVNAGSVVFDGIRIIEFEGRRALAGAVRAVTKSS